MTAALSRSFASLRVPNYRRYFAGQIVSVSGNWMQIVAEIWLVVAITGSGLAVGVTSALQFLPLLLFGAWGGLLADRIAKRRLLVVTQALMAVPAVVLFALTVSGAVEAWMVMALAAVRGIVLAVDNPTRQSFVIEMVGSERVVNAVGLNSVLIHASRVIGPGLAGVLIATVGVEPCFLLNALSFGAMIVALAGMEPRALSPSVPVAREPGAIRAALRYVRATPQLAIPLALMALVGTLSFNFLVILPLLARFTFDAGPGGYAMLASAMGIGSVAGALLIGARGQAGPGFISATAAAFGLLALAVAAAPSLAVAAALLTLVGLASVSFAAAINSWLQLQVDPQMRGRVMALYSIVFLGSTPIGGPIAGWLAETIDPRASLALAGLAALTAALGGRYAFARWLTEDAATGSRDRGAHRLHARGAGDAARPERVQVVRGDAARARPLRLRGRGRAQALGHSAGGDRVLADGLGERDRQRAGPAPHRQGRDLDDHRRHGLPDPDRSSP